MEPLSRIPSADLATNGPSSMKTFHCKQMISTPRELPPLNVLPPFRAFRQLFGYSTGLCMSTMPAQLSMSLAMVAPMSLAAPNMSLGAGFLSFAPGMSLAGAANGMTDVVYGSQEGTDSAPGPGGSASETHVASDTSVTDGPPSSTTTSTSPGAVAAISAAAVVAVAAVGAAVFVKNRNNVASSAYSVSVASFHP